MTLQTASLFRAVLIPRTIFPSKPVQHDIRSQRFQKTQWLLVLKNLPQVSENLPHLGHTFNGDFLVKLQVHHPAGWASHLYNK